MSMSSEKLLVRPDILRKYAYASVFIGGTSQLPEKAPYLKQLVEGCRGCREQSQKVTLPPWALAL